MKTIFFIIVSLLSSVLYAEEALPPELKDVGIEEHLGQKIPLDLIFQDDAGKSVRLADYFNKGKPVLINFAYFRCPMLCNMVLKGMLDGMKNLTWTPGKEYEVLTISIDPRETAELAAAKKKTHVDELNMLGSEKGWHFLTGKEENIQALTKIIGFGYKYNKASDDYAHAAGIFTLTPDGKISRYLYGIDYKGRDLKLALLDASDGKSLSLGEKLVMLCYRYDADARSYVLFARNMMRGAGVLVVLFLLFFLGGFWLKEFRRKKNISEKLKFSN